MNCELRRVTKSMPDYSNIKSLYNRAFPADERAPFFILMSKAGKKDVDFWGIYDGDIWIGLMYVVNYERLSYIFYFAISDTKRGQGYGSAALLAAKEYYSGRTVFLAIEQLDENAPNYAERVKRKKFYKANGFTELNLRLREASVVYELLGIGDDLTAEGYAAMMDNYIGRITRRIVRMEIIS